jgi:PhzF family phenazine biosynthesis protein
MEHRIFLVDAFADKPFHGNPAAVCVLREEQSADWMQSVGAELNVSATAFVHRSDEGYELRWFTPTREIDLCGHGTLASAHLLWTEGIAPREMPIGFRTKSGVLTCRLADDLVELDFPATPPARTEPDQRLSDALHAQPSFFGKSKFDSFLVMDSEETVRSLKPDLRALGNVPAIRGVIVTSASQNPDYDFVSRFFAPAFGIDEDPVTGSAHCCLGPYWSERLGKTSMTAFQASKRGGTVRVRVDGDRVFLRGTAITILRGQLSAVS